MAAKVPYFLMAFHLCALENHVFAYRTGVPTSACDSMTPSHSGVAPNTTPPPYTIETNASAFRSGDVIEITLSSLQQKTFKGYFVQIHRKDSTERVTGLQEGMKGKILTCNNLERSAVTHFETAEKTNVTILWTAPQSLTDDVNVVATVVEHIDVFWVGVKSPVLAFGDPTSDAVTTERTDSPVEDNDRDPSKPDSGSSGNSTSLGDGCDHIEASSYMYLLFAIMMLGICFNVWQ